MDSPSNSKTPETDVLHFENQTRLSPEEIAKAVARHTHHHPSTPAQDTSTKPRTPDKPR